MQQFCSSLLRLRYGPRPSAATPDDNVEPMSRRARLLSYTLQLLEGVLCVSSLVVGSLFLATCDENRPVSIYLLLNGLYFLIISLALGAAFALLTSCAGAGPELAAVWCLVMAAVCAIAWPAIGVGLTVNAFMWPRSCSTPAVALAAAVVIFGSLRLLVDLGFLGTVGPQTLTTTARTMVVRRERVDVELVERQQQAA